MSTPSLATKPALTVENLDIAYRVRGIPREVVRGVSLQIERGGSYGLVGESGCGKSTVAMAVMRYLPSNGSVTGGTIHVDGEDLMAMGDADVRALRTRAVSMVYQNPGAALNPAITIGNQVAESFELLGSSRSEARERAREMLAKVQISDPDGVMSRYRHQLSGGMQQRVIIAMALASDPSLLILDEPTTGLDATVEAEVLDLVSALRAEFGTAVLFISHSLGIIARMCDTVGVLYAGRLVEEGPAMQVFEDPRHPYSVGLLRCLPHGEMRKREARLDTIPGYLPAIGSWQGGCVFADRCPLVQEVCRTDEPPLIEVGPLRGSRCHFHALAPDMPRSTPEKLADDPPPDLSVRPTVRMVGLSKTFRQGGGEVRALDDITLEVYPGETLGLVGESGSGKSTLARVLLGLTEPDEGSNLELDGQHLADRTSKREGAQVRALQIVFQNPDAALNRRHSVRRVLGRALGRLSGLTGKAREDRLQELAGSVRLADRFLGVRPSALSGGLKQRVAIARAFAGSPELVVCDEPTSALDVSVQAAILNLLADLQRDEHVAYLFISHDLGVVRYLSDRIAVLYLGRLMEVGPAEVVFRGPHHPYTEALLSAVPELEEDGRPRIRLEGEIPSHADPPSGCVFHTRCPRKLGAICEQQEPPLIDVEQSHAMRCHIPIEDLRKLQAHEAAE